jgi:hypothetical protein
MKRMLFWHAECTSVRLLIWVDAFVDTKVIRIAKYSILCGGPIIRIALTGLVVMLICHSKPVLIEVDGKTT